VTPGSGPCDGARPVRADERVVRLRIRVRGERAEEALARLHPVLEAGAEEREIGDVVEYSVYAAPEDLPAVERLRELAGDALVGVVRDEVPADWQRRWHGFLGAVRVGDLVIRPPWVDGAASDVVIDPGVSFGAGGHPTTRLCLQLLLDAPPGGPLCDWGAGTGVLAIAAARLGWDPVTAVDNDREALATIAANAALNAVELAAQWGDVTAGATGGSDPAAGAAADVVPWAPTVVANLTRGLLVAAAERGGRRPARLLASGMLVGEADDVVAAWGMREERRLVEDGWAAVALAS
jgi:ribosomal protein L11 methyltransferase